MTTVAVIGAGSVGRALGSGLAAAGHEVVFGVRDPSDPRHADLAVRRTPAAASGGAQVVILAVPADAVPATVASLDLRAGQVVVDATNAVRTPPPGGFPTVGALVASLLPEGVRLVKAFNTIGAEHLGNGRFGELRAFLPVAGDAEGLAVVLPLTEDLGFAPADLGGRDEIGLVEDHARLWIHLAFRRGWGRSFGFVAVNR